MMNGMVTINDEPTKSRIYRFCEKRIDQWIQDHKDEMKAIAEADDIQFTVSFTEQETHQVACTTEVQCKGASFRGWDLAQDTQNAFMHSLKRLQKSLQISP